MSPRLNSSLVIRRLLRVMLLVLIFSGSAFLVMYLALRGRSVEVPDVTGKSESEAMEILDDYGLRMSVKARANSARFDANLVSDQSPSAGTIIKTGQIVRVSISTGAPPTPTPTRKPSPTPDESPTPRPTRKPSPTPSDGI